MFKDLLEYESLDEACEDCFGFSNIILLRDFGPLKKGQKIDSIWFHLTTSTVEICDVNTGEVLQKFQFKIDAV